MYTAWDFIHLIAKLDDDQVVLGKHAQQASGSKDFLRNMKVSTLAHFLCHRLRTVFPLFLLTIFTHFPLSFLNKIAPLHPVSPIFPGCHLHPVSPILPGHHLHPVSPIFPGLHLHPVSPIGSPSSPSFPYLSWSLSFLVAIFTQFLLSFQLLPMCTQHLPQLKTATATRTRTTVRMTMTMTLRDGRAARMTWTTTTPRPTCTSCTWRGR